jgi:poly(A) polymerase
MAIVPPQAAANEIVAKLQQAGFTAFWVGGCVRDCLIGREPQDFDIATDAKPEQVEKLFKKTIPVGKKFGVIIVVENKQQFQVATFRAEAEYKDGRRPEHVRFANAEADAARRDFTVNGMFYDPLAQRIHDWVGGEKDLRAKIIRTIGRPEERFAEDHLRMLRAVRFAAQLHFQIERTTFAAIQSLAPKIRGISAERIRDELIKLFSPPHAGRGLDLLRESGLLEHILPELAATAHCEQSPDFHPEGNVFNHIRLMLDRMPAGADSLLPWAVLLHDIAKPETARREVGTNRIHFYGHETIGAEMAGEILRRLKFPNQQIAVVCAAVKHHMQFKDVKRMRKATLRRMLLRETFPLELELHRLDSLGSHGDLEHYDFSVAAAEELRHQPEIRPPLITGEDLLALGIPRGKRVGELLHEVRDRQLGDELKTRRAALAWVKKQIRSDG